MTKIFITLEDQEGQKVERVLQFNNSTVLPTNDLDMNVIVNEMIDTLIVTKKPLL
jgi:hypothetical protein